MNSFFAIATPHSLDSQVRTWQGGEYSSGMFETCQDAALKLSPVKHPKHQHKIWYTILLALQAELFSSLGSWIGPPNQWRVKMRAMGGDSGATPLWRCHALGRKRSSTKQQHAHPGCVVYDSIIEPTQSRFDFPSLPFRFIVGFLARAETCIICCIFFTHAPPATRLRKSGVVQLASEQVRAR